MDTNVLISEVALLYNAAATARNAGNGIEARANLVKLRALLNAQPELKADDNNHPPEPDEFPESK